MTALVKIALIQMRMTSDLAANIAKAVEMVKDAAGRGSQVICLPELYKTTYFPREEGHAAAALAETIPGESTAIFSRLAQQLAVVIVVPIFEAEDGHYFNSACVLDADGSLLGTYRKMHIPHDPFFYERSYFEPGNLGYPLFKSRYLTFSVLICYDQWFPEAARLAVLNGADLIFYPTAIGYLEGDPLSAADWQSAWQTIQRSHSIANGVHVAAVNRVGQEGEIAFWGESFVCDAFGRVIAQAGMSEDEVLTATIDVAQNEPIRHGWGLLHNRRPDSYSLLTAPVADGKPGDLGFSMPAEWEKHESTWLAWPHDELSFGKIGNVEKCYLLMIETLLRGEAVDLVVRDQEMQDRVGALLATRGIDPTRIRFHVYDYADVWFRDYGPIFVTDAARANKAMVHWQFNAWGNKYAELLKDGYIPRYMETELKQPCFRTHVVLEGGSIDGNGAGTFLTTEQCLLNPSRNPELSQSEIDAYLANYLGARHLIWLRGGIAGDDTDGHVDTVARFVGPRTVVCAFEDDPLDENYAILQENFAALSSARTHDGERLEIVRLPMPEPILRTDSDVLARLPASYLNFYIGNSAVLVPTFRVEADADALNVLRDLFPTREVVGIDCVDLLHGLGAIHCVTQQEPAAGPDR